MSTILKLFGLTCVLSEAFPWLTLSEVSEENTNRGCKQGEEQTWWDNRCGNQNVARSGRKWTKNCSANAEGFVSFTSLYRGNSMINFILWGVNTCLANYEDVEEWFPVKVSIRIFTFCHSYVGTYLWVIVESVALWIGPPQSHKNASTLKICVARNNGKERILQLYSLWSLDGDSIFPQGRPHKGHAVKCVNQASELRASSRMDRMWVCNAKLYW